jgi:predicted HicB family RNase H-like nuclease
MDRTSLHVRLPRSLHERLRELADDQDVSINTLLVAVVAKGVEWKLPPAQDTRT